MTHSAETLAKTYELGSDRAEAFYDYIVETLINGQRPQVRQLFNEMRKSSQQDFLINHLDLSIGYHKSVLNICIIELTQ